MAGWQPNELQTLQHGAARNSVLTLNYTGQMKKLLNVEQSHNLEPSVTVTNRPRKCRLLHQSQRGSFKIYHPKSCHVPLRWPVAWMEVLAVEMILGHLLISWWIRGRWGKGQNQGQLLKYLTGSWVVVDAVTEIEKTGGEIDVNGEKCKSSAWGLLTFRCLRATQVEILKRWSNVGLKRELRDLGRVESSAHSHTCHSEQW